MKTKLKLMALLLVIGCSSLQATAQEAPIQKSFKYVSFGLGPNLNVPCVSFGYRDRNESLGWESIVRASSSGNTHSVGTHLLGHYHLNSSALQSVYVGVGAALTGVVYNHKEKPLLSLAPVFVIGKEFDTQDMLQQFIELRVESPSWAFQKDHSRTSYPVCTYIQYGIAF